MPGTNYNKKIPVICYHSIGKFIPRWVKNHLTLEMPFFHDQMKYISKYYNTVNLNDYLKIRNEGKNHVRNPIVLTFDDGYLDNWIYVFPLLKKYGMKATIFVVPEFIDKKKSIRPNLEDVWEGRAGYDELHPLGFLSWDEIRMMEASGLVSIESHTMTHTKYFVSDEIVGFHYPGSDCIYPIGNHFREWKPYYISNPEFEKLIPYGYPFFKQSSSVVARRVTINQAFIDSVIDILSNYDWTIDYDFDELFRKIQSIYLEFKNNNRIIERVETESEYNNRILFELKESKAIIENELNKKVEFLCWPHGDNNSFVHNLALKIGYKATTIGNMPDEHLDNTRIERIGMGTVKDNRFLSLLKAKHKIRRYREMQPDYTIKKVYEYCRDVV
jgi:peptidoglycan/xylan/chitin deacetylase (PgdA/CDA1 family)